MGLFFNYDNSVCNEGATPVIFSYDPSISSLKELLIYELSQMSYYEVKLRELGENTSKITDFIINYITLAVVNLDFRKDRFLSIIKTLYDEVVKLKLQYKEICIKQNVEFEPIMGEKLSFEKSKEKINAVNFGEKQSLIKNTVFSKTKKMLSDIVLMLISNACLCITELENYEVNAGIIKYKIPELLKSINYDSHTDKSLKLSIINFAKINFKIMTKLNDIIMTKYGPIEETEVNINIRKGKCILVTGHYYKNLEMLLESAKNENINIYTHNEMLFAHSFSLFHKYKNLIGHYQGLNNNIQIDFSSFPGAVLITKNSHSHFDVIRGRIFTPDNNPAYGIYKISENDFSPLIESAKSAKGFIKDTNSNKITVGYNISEVKERLKKIGEGIINNTYKHLFIIGTMSYNISHNDYFEEFYKYLPDDCYVISFSYNKIKNNVWHINSYSDMNLIYLILDELKRMEKIVIGKTTVFIPHCHIQMISHAFNMKIIGVKNIFLGECCPNIINPSLIDGMSKLFKINTINNSAQKDLEKVLKIKR
ncbi:hypothetical protein IJG14_02520 [bacterium]|nr:hypothetical protein [bacterium]